MTNLPNVTEIIGKDEMRPSFNFAIVHNGVMQATNGYILANIDLSDSLSDTCLENIEGKVFKKETIKEINKAESATFEEEDIHLVSKSGRLIKIPYDGYTTDRSISENKYNRETKQLETKHIGRFPIFRELLEGEGFENLSEYNGINPAQLLSAAKAFLDFSKDITLEFSHRNNIIKVKSKNPNASKKTCCALYNRAI